MGCGTSFVKYVLFFFNLLFALCGLAILGLGIVIKLHITEFQELIDKNWGLTWAPTVCIVLGSIIFIISFFGCCGAIRESHCMVVSYAILMLVIIILQVVIAVLIFVYIGDVEKAVGEILRKAFADDTPIVKEAFNSMQASLHCCGVNGPLDYPVISIPKSCCPKEVSYIENAVNACIPYQDGCASVLSNYAKVSGKTAGGVVIGVAVIEVIGSIFALCLANSIKNAERRYR